MSAPVPLSVPRVWKDAAAVPQFLLKRLHTMYQGNPETVSAIVLLPPDVVAAEWKKQGLESEMTPSALLAASLKEDAGGKRSHGQPAKRSRKYIGTAASFAAFSES